MRDINPGDILTSKSDVNVRQQPNITSAIVRTAKANTSIGAVADLTMEDDGLWFQVKDGYVKDGNYITIKSNTMADTKDKDGKGKLPGKGNIVMTLVIIAGVAFAGWGIWKLATGEKA